MMMREPTVTSPSYEVVRLTREDFLQNYWDYEPGEHLMIFAPTQNGKTTLLFELLIRTATPTLPATVLVTKPRDKTVTAWTSRLRFKTVREWPPPLFTRLMDQPPGYVLWPKFTMNPDVDDAHVAAVMNTCLRAQYAAGKKPHRKGHSITVADEVYALCEEYKLTKPVVTILTKGGGMGVGEWGATQKPSHIPLWFYSQPTHLFIGCDTDKRARQRYGEISGNFDPALIDEVVRTLPRFHFLYINTREQTLCIIGP
jgi:hypothetical protein